MADEILPNSGMELPDIGGDQDTWGDILNENLRILDRAITLGAESIALAGTDVTLDEDQATKGVLRLSGVLTANVNVVVPASPVRLYLVENNTTGAFTVAIKTPLGTGVTVLQGTSSLVYSNGTNVVQGATSVNGSFAVSGGFSAGSINNTPIGATTPNTGAFTNLSYTGTLTGGTGLLNIGSGQIYKTAGGDVGIGTATPLAKLDVRGNATFTGNGVNRQTADFTNTGSQLFVGVESSGGGAVFTGSTAYAGIVGTNTNTPFQIATNGTVKTTLFQSGNFNIGGTRDAERLVVTNLSATSTTVLANTIARVQSNGSGADANIQFADGVAFAANIGMQGGNIYVAPNGNQRALFTSGGYFKASNTGNYKFGGNNEHEFNSSVDGSVLYAVSTSTNSNVSCFYADLPSSAGGNLFIGKRADVTTYQVLANGDVRNTNNSYGAISDAKLKNIIAARDGKYYWEKFKRIKFWIYRLLADPTNQQLLGVVAQEFREIFPGLVNSSPDMHAVKKTREVTTEIQVTMPVQKEQIRTEIVSEGGRYIQKQIIETVTVDEPVFDQFPLYDETGSLVMQLVSAEEPPQVDEKGEEISPAKPAVYAPVIHQVPRMTTVTTTEEYEELEPNGEVTLSVNYSILGLIADTITQELQFRVEDLTARLEALEAQ